MIFSGTYFPLCGVDEAIVYVNGTDGGTAEELGRAVVVMVQEVDNVNDLRVIDRYLDTNG